MSLLIGRLIIAWERQAASNAECYSYKRLFPSTSDDASDPTPDVCKLHLCSFFVTQGATFKELYINASYFVSRNYLRTSHDRSMRYRSRNGREALHIKQHKQYTYNVTSRSVRAKTDAVEKQYILHTLGVYL
jgi:hypothetical protein